MSKPWLMILFSVFVILGLSALIVFYLYPKNAFHFLQSSNDRINPIAKEVKVVETSGTLVEGFPDLPVLPNSVVKSSYHRRTVPPSYEATWMSDQPVSQTIQWYITNLPVKGWEIVEKPDLNDTATEQQIVAKKGDAYLHLTVEDEDDEEKMDEMSDEQSEKIVGTPQMKTIINAEMSEPRK